MAMLRFGAARKLGGVMLVAGCVAMKGRFLVAGGIFSCFILMGTEGGVDAGLVDAGSLVWVFKECKLVLADCKQTSNKTTKCNQMSNTKYLFENHSQDGNTRTC